MINYAAYPAGACQSHATRTLHVFQNGLDACMEDLYTVHCNCDTLSPFSTSNQQICHLAITLAGGKVVFEEDTC